MARKRGPRLPAEFFLSHSSPDRAFVDRVVDVLRDHRIAVWYSRTNIAGAQQWHDEIGKALERCDWFGVVVSPAAVASKWVKRELRFALDDDRYVDKIVPLLYQPCEIKQLSWTLPGFQMVDFTGDFAEGCHDLLRIWGLGHARR